MGLIIMDRVYFERYFKIQLGFRVTRLLCCYVAYVSYNLMILLCFEVKIFKLPYYYVMVVILEHEHVAMLLGSRS